MPHRVSLVQPDMNYRGSAAIMLPNDFGKLPCAFRTIAMRWWPKLNARQHASELKATPGRYTVLLLAIYKKHFLNRMLLELSQTRRRPGTNSSVKKAVRPTRENAFSGQSLLGSNAS